MVSAWLAMCAGWIASAMRPWLGCWDGACLGVRGTPLCRDVTCLCAAPQAGSMTLPVGRKSVLEAVHASEQTPSGELEFKVLAVSSATELSGVSTAPVAGFLHVYVRTPGVFVSLGVCGARVGCMRGRLVCSHVIFTSVFLCLRRGCRTKVSMEAETLTVLAPCAIALPSRYLLWSKISWTE
jgi:hypothetical protein